MLSPDEDTVQAFEDQVCNETCAVKSRKAVTHQFHFENVEADNEVNSDFELPWNVENYENEFRT